MEHPIEKCRKSQAEFLKSCPEEERAFHEYLFRVGNASYIYHSQATEGVSKASLRTYYKEWLSDLPDNVARDMKVKGFEACKTIVPFTRYVNERTDIGMTDWMKEHLSEADFEEWVKIKERNE